MAVLKQRVHTLTLIAGPDAEKLQNYIDSFVIADDATSGGVGSIARVGPCKNYKSLKTVNGILMMVPKLKNATSQKDLDAGVEDIAMAKSILFELVRGCKKAVKDLETAQKQDKKQQEMKIKKDEKAAQMEIKMKSKQEAKLLAQAKKQPTSNKPTRGADHMETNMTTSMGTLRSKIQLRDEIMTDRYQHAGQVPQQAFTKPFIIEHVFCRALLFTCSVCERRDLIERIYLNLSMWINRLSQTESQLT